MNTHPTPIERVRVLVSDYLNTSDSYPLIVPVRDDIVQDRLNAADAKAQQRRFDDEARITAMGDLHG